MKLDFHHLVLYWLLFLVSLGAFGIFHEWRMDIAAAKAKAGEQDRAIADLQNAAAAREKAYQDQIRSLEGLRVTKNTPAPLIITRLANLEPSLAVTPDQLVAPKPDAPKANLVLEPAQQIDLVNRLVDCKECEAERDKLKLDLLGSIAKTNAMTKERDDWKTAVKGGSLKQRIKRRFWAFVEDAAILEALRAASGHP